MAAICVSCSGKADVPARYVADVAHLGAVIAAHGHSLVFGGGRSGMMGALSDAAAVRGAHVVGIAPPAVLDRKPSRSAVGQLVVAADLGSRKAEMLARSDMIIVLPGGLGTLDELFEVWTLGPQLKVHDFPVVLLNTHGFYDGLLEWLRSRAEDDMMHARLIDELQVVTSAEDAITCLPA